MKTTKSRIKQIRITLLNIIFLSIGLNVYAQDYLIRFAGSGSSTTVSNITVENLTKSTSVNLTGTDILHLKSIVSGITPIDAPNENKFKVYPNPVEENCQIAFETNKSGDVCVNIFEISGKSIVKFQSNLPCGTHYFQLGGLSNGLFVVSVITQEYSASTKLVSNSLKNAASSPFIHLMTDSELEILSENRLNKLKSSTLETVLQYSTGDLLKYIGTSGNYTTVVMDIPKESKTITFDFILCADPDKKNYATVKIGNQIWMAENLAYLPSVNPSKDGSDTEKLFYVYGYNGTDVSAAKATSNYKTYGVFYNWAAAMNGATSSNTNPSKVRGICPEGWHLPSDSEWSVLETTAGGTNIAGTKLKSKKLWNVNDKRTDEFGFNAIPAGYRDIGGNFFGNGSNASFWTTTRKDELYGISRSIDYNYEDIEHTNSIIFSGFCIRCLKD